MFEWLNSEGRRLRYHEAGVPKYVSNIKELGRENPQSQQLSQRPFPLNPNFVSEPILGEDMRREIYRRVVKEKKSVRVVSIELRVEMRRVAAVVRLMELERAWKSQVCSCSLSLILSLLIDLFALMMRYITLHSISLYDLRECVHTYNLTSQLTLTLLTHDTQPDWNEFN